MRTVSRSRPSFCRTLTATPWPSFMRPRRRCSVPTKLWLKRSASLRASASTCWARGVKLFIASSLILSLINALGRRFVQFSAFLTAFRSGGEEAKTETLYYLNRNQYLKVNLLSPGMHLKTGSLEQGMSKQRLRLWNQELESAPPNGLGPAAS